MMKNALKKSSVVKKFAALFMFVLTIALITNAAKASKRVALVIGNSAYVNATPLKNPRNDAEDLSVKLLELGFEVVSGFDLDSRGLRDKVRDFGEKLRDADVAMFFYAGHALQVNGRNYLAPVNTDIRHEGDLDFETIPMDFIQRQMERQTKTVLLFLDACRNNPLARNLTKSSRSTGATRGLARETTSAKGTFIAFATQPDNVALDGDGRNSPFTTALLRNISRPNIEISAMMTDVRQQVYKATGEQQLPWTNSSLLGHFYFNNKAEGTKVASLEGVDTTTIAAKPEPVASSKPVAPVTVTPVAPTNNSSDQLLSMRLEQLAWESVKDTNDVDELTAFVNKFGDGFFGDLAKLRLAKIKRNKTAPAKPVQVASLEEKDASRKIQVEEAIRDEPAAAPAPKVVTREITRQIQAELNRVGCNLGRADGLWGAKSSRALSKFSKHAKVRLATLQPTHNLLDKLREYDKRICPAPVVVAPPRAPKVRKQQVRTCQPGQRLSRKGNCYWPKVQQVKTCQPGQRLSRKGNCYWPRQQQQVIVHQPQPQVIVRQPQPQVIVRQPPPRRNNGLLGGAIGGAIGSAIINCGILKNC